MTFVDGHQGVSEQGRNGGGGRVERNRGGGWTRSLLGSRAMDWVPQPP